MISSFLQKSCRFRPATISEYAILIAADQWYSLISKDKKTVTWNEGNGRARQFDPSIKIFPNKLPSLAVISSIFFIRNTEGEKGEIFDKLLHHLMIWVVIKSP